jgi:DMSO reductase family type II enzyme chaperone
MSVARTGTEPLQEGLDRARVYRVLAALFRAPEAGLLEPGTLLELHELEPALARLADEKAKQGSGRDLPQEASELARRLESADPARLAAAYQETFEPSGGLRCPPNETAHTAQTPQHALVRTFELADVAGFYRAFGVEVAPGTERPDHVGAELEFMHLLAVKEAVARQDEEAEHAQICRDAARAFLRDHLARWASRFAERLEEDATDPVYAQAGRLLGRFVEHDAQRLGAG